MSIVPRALLEKFQKKFHFVEMTFLKTGQKSVIPVFSYFIVVKIVVNTGRQAKKDIKLC